MPEKFESRNTPVSFLPKERRVIEPRWAATSAPDPERLHLVEECSRVVMRLRFEASVLPVDDIEFEVLRDGIQISVRMLVPDRSTSAFNWIQVWRNLVVPWGPLAMNGSDILVRMLRDVVAGAILHEVDESFTHAGVRVFDPHRSLGLG